VLRAPVSIPFFKQHLSDALIQLIYGIKGASAGVE
jgi:hypothetical protein